MVYQIDQKLADVVYSSVNTITIYDEDGITPLSTWKKAALEKDADGNPTKYLEYSNPSTGYYGAVYTDGNGKYILANRGTEITRASDIHADINMWQGKVPAQLADAKKLMDQADNKGFTISEIVGHSLGGSLSQMLGVIYNIATVTYNAYNTREILDNSKELTTEQRTEYTDRAAKLNAEVAAMPSSDPQLTIMRQNALNELSDLENQLAEDSLAQAWQKNSSGSNIVNYRIVGDPVSSYLKEPQVGEDITILNANGDAENITAMLEAMNANSLAGEIANLGFHFMDNFSIENLMNSDKNITIKDSLGMTNSLLELAEYFKDKNNFEIDQAGVGSITIGKDHELYVGFGNKWTSSGDDRSQLITSVHDSIYSNAGYKSSGSLSQVQMMIERIQAQFANSKYFYVKSVESPDLQTYMLIAPKDPTIDPNTNNYLTNAENWRPPRDPLAVDLDGDGIETISQNAGIVFDTDADGLKTGTSWLKGDDGWLVIDKNNNGKIDNGSELFGDAYVKQDQTKAKDAYDALGDIDSNHDGMITAADAKFAELKIWQDQNQNGISEANELKTLSEIGLVELKVGRTSSTATNLGNGVVTNGGSTTVINGVEQQTGALNLSQNTFYREFLDKLDTSSVADLPELVGSGLVRDLREAMTLSTKLTQDVRTYMSSNATERSKMLDELASDWAATSMLSTSKNRHTEAHTDFYFGGVDSSAQSVMLDKLAIVETFNGRRINAGNESQTVIYKRDMYGNVLRDVNGSPLVSYVHTNVSFSDAQTSWILQSYNSIINSIDKGLSIYADVFPLLAQVKISLSNEENAQIKLDFESLYSLVDTSNSSDVMHNLASLYRYCNEECHDLFSSENQKQVLVSRDN